MAARVLDRGAVAQPVKRLQANWIGAAHSTIAAIVVDTSFSMQLRDADVSLLQRADRAVQDLLRSELKDARVGLFTSREHPSGHEQLTTASTLLSEWAPLSPEASALPCSWSRHQAALSAVPAGSPTVGIGSS